MFYCAEASGTGSGTGSKAETLRRVVTENLAAAARGILAALERTVAGYEEEAAGLRRQLELLQPRVRLDRRECDRQETNHGRLDLKAELVPPRKEEDEPGPVVVDTRSLRLHEEELTEPAPRWKTPSDTELVLPRKEEDEPGPVVVDTRSLSLHEEEPSDEQEELTEPAPRPDRKLLLLRVCLLEDSGVDVLSPNVLQRWPVRELPCPRGLREPDFLGLLRSTFPPLAADRPFDLFTADRSRRLRPLRANTLTPEEVVGAGALYIRLKAGEEPRGAAADVPSRSVTVATVETQTNRPEKRRRRRPGLGQPAAFRAVMLEDPEPDVVSVKCEPDVLAQLSATFPQAAGDALESDTGGGPPQLEGEPCVRAETGDEDDKELCRRDAAAVESAGMKSADTSLEPRSRGFACTSHLTRHRRTHAADRPHKCDLCPKTFHLKRQLQVHSMVHTDRDRLTCPVCSKTFCSPYSLVRHAVTHSGERRHGCHVCGKRFKLPAALKAHEKVHAPRQLPIVCHVCGKTFCSPYSLVRHAVTHSGERRHGCRVCGKRFKLPAALKAHEKVHTVPRCPIVCHVCSKTFVATCGLMAHLKTHRDAVCAACGKACVSSRELKRHMVTHSGERRHGCRVCGKRFKLPAALKAHEKIHAVRQWPIVCHVCSKTFVATCGLMAHLKTHRDAVCAACGEACVSSRELKRHMRLHAKEAPR